MTCGEITAPRATQIPLVWDMAASGPDASVVAFPRDFLAVMGRGKDGWPKHPRRSSARAGATLESPAASPPSVSVPAPYL